MNHDDCSYGGTTAAGPYAKLPYVQFDCEEIDPTATISSIADFVEHWLHQHEDAYVHQIFKVESSVSTEDAREALSGAGAGLLAFPRAETDERAREIP